jgi:hypothetical protein
MSDPIGELIDKFKAERWDSRPYDRALEIARGTPERVGELVTRIVREIPKGGTFLDMVISFMPLEDFPDVVRAALDVLARDPENEAAGDTILRASMQNVQSLHPHLSRIFELRVNHQSYYQFYPWRESGMLHADYLKKVIGDTSKDDDMKKDAWRALLETRDPEAMKLFRDGNNLADSDIPLEYWFKYVGFEMQPSGGFRQLYAAQLYHILFPETYMGPAVMAWIRETRHPTWGWDMDQAGMAEARFGGSIHGKCPVCGRGLHPLLTLDPVPEGIGVTGIGRLSLSACMRCVFYGNPVFYRHAAGGGMEALDGAETHQGDDWWDADMAPLTETAFRLWKTPARWKWQDHAIANSRENLFRLGGDPPWIQNPDYLTCPTCGETMSFLGCLDSDIPVDGGEGETLMWDDGGMCYIAWCDRCKVSGYVVQSY